MSSRNINNLRLDLSAIKNHRAKSSPPNQEKLNQQERLTNFLTIKDTIKEIKLSDLNVIREIGHGSGGHVNQTCHKPTAQTMATKVIHLDLNESHRNAMIRELDVLHECKSPYIIGFYGAFYAHSALHLCMEYMDVGSLDTLTQIVGRYPEPIIAKVALSVVRGLVYLRSSHSIIHRDIKPSNILVNSAGEIKLCDFGVSGYLVDSMANSFVGTKSYMAPERLLGAQYSVQSDIWSLGLMLIELAVGVYPIPAIELNLDPNSFGANISDHWAAAERGILLGDICPPDREEMSIFDMLEYINSEPPPKLPSFGFTSEFCDLVDSCLQKNPQYRTTLKLLENNPYLNTPELNSLHMSKWISKVTSKSKL